jgi:hypothetical protein
MKWLIFEDVPAVYVVPKRHKNPSPDAVKLMQFTPHADILISGKR